MILGAIDLPFTNVTIKSMAFCNSNDTGAVIWSEGFPFDGHWPVRFTWNDME